jgi:hypothetical protein
MFVFTRNISNTRVALVKIGLVGLATMATSNNSHRWIETSPVLTKNIYIQNIKFIRFFGSLIKNEKYMQLIKRTYLAPLAFSCSTNSGVLPC